MDIANSQHTCIIITNYIIYTDPYTHSVQYSGTSQLWTPLGQLQVKHSPGNPISEVYTVKPPIVDPPR